MLISLIMLEHMAQRCEQGLAVLLPALPDLGGDQRRNLLQKNCFYHECMYKIAHCMLASIPGVSQPSLGVLSTQLPSLKHRCVSSVSETRACCSSGWIPPQSLESEGCAWLSIEQPGGSKFMT